MFIIKFIQHKKQWSLRREWPSSTRLSKERRINDLSEGDSSVPGEQDEEAY